ncbi:MAG TPA: DUF4097 family beta strand repeat-containing protein [Candidatus Binatia bacterium]|nr:DUF4097 family beta strand repeat-containing protein [Candidatus Binatia bacterium]
MRAFLLITVIALGGCAGSFGERYHETVHQALAAGEAPLVRVDNVAGTVRIDGWRRPVVDVVAIKYGSDEQELRNVGVTVRREGGAISIATSYSGSTNGGGVRYRISVPLNASLRVGNVAGEVEIANVGGDVAVDTQAGAITADLGGVTGSRSVDLNATTGAIRLTLAPQSDASVEASSTVGAFSSDLSQITQARENLVGVRASGKIGTGSAHVRLTTTTGAIALRSGS